MPLFISNPPYLICCFVPVGRDLLHNELHHLQCVIPSWVDKTPEAPTMLQQDAAAFSQHLVNSYIFSISTFH